MLEVVSLLEEIGEVVVDMVVDFLVEVRGGFGGRVPSPMGFDICPGLDNGVSNNSQNPKEPSSGVGLSQSQSEPLSNVNSPGRVWKLTIRLLVT